ncbi:MAG: hypothetical protein L6R38_002073 [Xanthoria sp. 2 TBL-2021]|nr:MAG: hypothetical protein L6R38_002073 [Xanthoria sp. 2 TBL-2021]
MPSSYKQTGRLPPLRYRTPSPPIDAFEPHTPTFDLLSGSEAPAQWPAAHDSRNTSEQPTYGQSNQNVARRTQSHSSQDSMDAFASIVLSTSSAWPRPNKSHRRATPPNQHCSAIEQSDERPAKRARSEKLPSPVWVRTPATPASRPATSYESITDSRTMEAELLLNFSHSARFATAPTTAQAHLCTTGRGHPEIKASEEEKASPKTRPPDCLTYPSSNDAGYPAVPRHTENLQHLPRSNGEIPAHSSKLSKKNVSIAFPPEMPTQDFRHQLIEASNFGQRPISSSDTQFAHSSPAQHQLRQGRNSPHVVGEHRISRLTLAQPRGKSVHHGHGGYLEDGPVDLELSAVSDEEAKKDSMVEPRATHEHRILANSYWPSMLATTVEQSMCTSKIRPQEVIQKLESRISRPNNATGVPHSLQTGIAKAARAPEPAVCAACNFTRNSISAETDAESTSWISCDGCKNWFHFACAGFKSEREVRAVDKFRCRGCKKIHGPTTYVRKSARAHTAIDYAGLNQGVIKTSDERPEHHYIKPIRDGTINIQPESFARMRPELVTAEHFEKGSGMKEPIVIPAEFNPRPGPAGASERSANAPSEDHSYATLFEDWFACDPECRNVPDHGQDALDMVIPRDLTVRKVAELYGPEEKIEVIDVKSQNGEGKKWNMRRWADYYENASKKVVRNVISLEVSQSILGRLIRRPQIVRDLDLQDSVWPADLQAKGEFPHVQFYCLMSVADCFTDFHIDFGGSSVFYHILKGRKTFFFIPPKEKHLKKYEEWCMSPAQNWTFLGDQTKECYRVDLSEGDTMLIPAGWIHAVWTPEDSLVIGGNFLTRLNYSMQLRIAQVEKTTGVARKFRYPHFQKIQWYTAIRYLESDPVPVDLRTALEAGGIFHRQSPAYHDFNTWGENSRSGPEYYHARYYSQPELEGLPDLVRYLLRTALIDSGEITEGITVDARNAVKKSIPRGYGEPLEIVKDFAVWCAWKRGNESIPHWAHADAVHENGVAESTAKLSGAALKKIESEAAVQAPRRHSARNQVQQPTLPAREPGMTQDIHTPNNIMPSEKSTSSLLVGSEALRGESSTPYGVSSIDGDNHAQSETPTAGDHKRRKVAPGSGTGSQRKTACESCRRRRRACKHKTDPTPQTPRMPFPTPTTAESQEPVVDPSAVLAKASSRIYTSQSVESQPNTNPLPVADQKVLHNFSRTTSTEPPQPDVEEYVSQNTTDTTMYDPLGEAVHDISPQEAGYRRATPKGRKAADRRPSTTPQSRGRSKACNECRKSKRRCLHDEHGLEDPIKCRDAAYPRSPTATKRRKLDGPSPEAPVQPKPNDGVSPEHVFPHMNPAPPTSLLLPSGAEENAPTAVIREGIHTVHAKADCRLPSDVIQEPQASLQLNNAVDSVPDPRSSNCTRIMAEDLTPPSIREQDASELQTNAVRSIESPKRDAMQQTSVTPINVLKHEMPSVQLESSDSFGQPAASSLVSPPASSHEDSEQPNPVGEPKRTYSGSSSRHSSRHRQTQRFTPESGPTRRDSSSSVVVNTPAVEDKWSSTSPSVSSGQALDAAQTQSKARLQSETLADEESLKLIRALQAQDYGLRRRSRAA